MKFDNAFLQANGNVGMQFKTRTGMISVWKDKDGIHCSEGVSDQMKAAAIAKYIIMKGKFHAA